jgi:hypothetical protein
MRSTIRRQQTTGRSWVVAAGVACLAAAGCGSIQLLGDAGVDATSGGSGGGNGGGNGTGIGGSKGTANGGRTGSADASADAPIDRPIDRPVDSAPDLGVDRGSCLCPALYQPVCGVDGRTYGTSCDAQCAGVAVAHQGACVDAGPVTCVRAQGCCGADSDCTALQECAGPACSGAGAKATGVCKTRPTSASGSCWTNADCTSGAGSGTCAGASVCPCGSACLVADMTGTCSH